MQPAMKADLELEPYERKSISLASADQGENYDSVEEFQLPAAESSSMNVKEIKGIRFILLVGALLSAVFCVALDNTSK